MDHAEYVRYKDWCDRVFDEEKDRLEKSILNRVETDPRVRGKKEVYLQMFAKRLDQCSDLGVDKFKNSLLSSGDDDEYMLGVLLHNALQSLYVKDFKDEVILPSETENKMKRKELQALRHKQNLDAKPDERELNLTAAQEGQLEALGGGAAKPSLTAVEEEEDNE